MAGIPGTLKDSQAAQMLIDLEKSLYQFLGFRGYWDERARLSEWGYQAGKALSQWSDAGWGAYHVAMTHYWRGETKGATSWGSLMAEVMERGAIPRDKATAIRFQGLIAQECQNWAKAERLYQEALAIYLELEEEAVQSLTLNDLGNVARSQGQYDRAESYYKQALAIEEKRGDKERQASYCSNLGHIALDRDRPSEARTWYERGLALAQEVGRQDLVASAQVGLAQVLEKEGHYPEALLLAKAALEIYDRLRDSSLEGTRQLVERLRGKAG